MNGGPLIAVACPNCLAAKHSENIVAAAAAAPIRLVSSCARGKTVLLSQCVTVFELKGWKRKCTTYMCVRWYFSAHAYHTLNTNINVNLTLADVCCCWRKRVCTVHLYVQSHMLVYDALIGDTQRTICCICIANNSGHRANLLVLLNSKMKVRVFHSTAKRANCCL